MTSKKFKLKNLLFVVLFLSNCGGGGNGSPSSITNTPISQGGTAEKEIEKNLYIPKEVFETPEYKNQWGLEAINASSAYSYGGTGKGVIIGVIDEALDKGPNPEKKKKILKKQNTIKNKAKEFYCSKVKDEEKCGNA